MSVIGMVIGWMISGLIIGALARMLHPGRDAMGWGGTILLGVVGSLVGGGISYLLHFGTSPFAPAGYILSIIGAIVVLAMGWFATRPARV